MLNANAFGSNRARGIHAIGEARADDEETQDHDPAKRTDVLLSALSKLDGHALDVAAL